MLPKEELTTQLNVILEPEKLKLLVEQLYIESDNEIKCQIMERIVQMIVENELDFVMIPSLTLCLSSTLSPQIHNQIFPINNPNDDSLTDSISKPLFVMFRNYFQLCKEEDSRRKLLGRVLSELQSVQPKTGYLLLYFLKVWAYEEEKREAEKW